MTDKESALFGRLARIELGKAFRVRVERLDAEDDRIHLVLSAEPDADAIRAFVWSMAEQGIRVTYERRSPSPSSTGASRTPPAVGPRRRRA